MKFKFKLFVVLALLISISSLPSNVFCTTLTWEFTGHITGIDIPLETLSVDDNFAGFFSDSYENTPTPDFGGGTYNSNDNLNIAEHSSTPLFHIYGDLDTFESGGSSPRPEPVPEPTTLMLLGTAIFAFTAPIRKLLVNLGITL